MKYRDEQLRLQLLGRFRKSGAHADLGEVLNGVSWKQAGTDHNNLPYNIWQLAEHLRITQYDILEFCRTPDYKSPDWPSGYWPPDNAPENEEVWHNTIAQIKNDNEAFADLKRKVRFSSYW